MRDEPKPAEGVEGSDDVGDSRLLGGGEVAIEAQVSVEEVVADSYG